MKVERKLSMYCIKLKYLGVFVINKKSEPYLKMNRDRFFNTDNKYLII